MATISHADKLALLLAAGDAKRSHKYTSLTSNERKRYIEYLSKLTLVQNFFLSRTYRHFDIPPTLEERVCVLQPSE